MDCTFAFVIVGGYSRFQYICKQGSLNICLLPANLCLLLTAVTVVYGVYWQESGDTMCSRIEEQ